MLVASADFGGITHSVRDASLGVRQKEFTALVITKRQEINMDERLRRGHGSCRDLWLFLKRGSVLARLPDPLWPFPQ